MENKQNKNPQLKLAGRHVLIGVVGIIGIIATYTVGTEINRLIGGSQYQSITLKLNDEYAKMRTLQEQELADLIAKHAYDICMKEKVIAASKWEDAKHGVKFEGVDWQALRMKADRDCSVLPGNPESKQKEGGGGVPVAKAAIEYDAHVATIDHDDYAEKLSGELEFGQTKIDMPHAEVISDKTNPLDKLAHAVAIAETSGCTKGYAVTHNNCHGIKKGNTYPCQTKGKSRMCNFSTKEESFVAFKVIWAKWYKNHVPTKANAIRWTGNDRADTWLKHVKANL